MGHIVIKHEEVPKLITKLYKLINLPRKCVVDKEKKADYVVINTSKEKVISIHKLCHEHEHKRRRILWRKAIHA